MKKTTWVIIGVFIVVVEVPVIWLWLSWQQTSHTTQHHKTAKNLPLTPIASPSLPPLPTQKILPNDYHIFQTFNNCGPAALSIVLSYYGINVTQQELGKELRPYQIAGGDNDDKSVTLEELADKSKEYGFIPYHRPNGNVEMIKRFVTIDVPVITRTITKSGEDIGHYRVVKGYDEASHELIQDDSLQGKNLRYSYSEFESLWQKFNYEYLVLIPQEKQPLAQIILGQEADEYISWQNAVSNAENQLGQNPGDIYARFNLAVALYNVGEYERSVREFEAVEHRLPFRTLWYQIEPIEAYFKLGHYNRVLALTDKILANHNRAFSELYLIRGEIYKQQGNITAARGEFEKAIIYNQNLDQAHAALASVAEL